jgi:hypothetical protein
MRFRQFYSVWHIFISPGTRGVDYFIFRILRRAHFPNLLTSLSSTLFNTRNQLPGNMKCMYFCYYIIYISSTRKNTTAEALPNFMGKIERLTTRRPNIRWKITFESMDNSLSAIFDIDFALCFVWCLRRRLTLGEARGFLMPFLYNIRCFVNIFPSLFLLIF